MKYKPDVDGLRTIVYELANLQYPAPDKPPLGVVVGNLEFEPTGDSVLVSLFLLTRLGRGRWVSMAILAAALASLLASEWWISEHPSAVFFLFPFRVVEFAIGGLLATASPGGKRGIVDEFALLLGLLLILYVGIPFNEDTPFPSMSSCIEPSSTCRQPL